MKFIINRDKLLPAVQKLSNVVSKKPNLPVLSNLLLKISPDSVSIAATDMEVELITTIGEKLGVECDITIPARKLADICRTLPQGAALSFEVKDERIIIQSGKSRFILSGMPAQDFPVVDISETEAKFSINRARLCKLIENTQFAMGKQDVRYYLNGLLMVIGSDSLRCVATDGHRLALDEIELDISMDESKEIIVPRKGVVELLRLLNEGEEDVEFQVSSNHIRVACNDICFTSKLIDGKFPDYQRVIPEKAESVLISDKEELKQSLTRVSILSNEKYHGVRIICNTNKLQALAQNADQDEAEEEIDVQYQGEDLEIGFNVSYLLDPLLVINTEEVVLSIADPSSSCLILPNGASQCKYVVMPMRL